MKGASASAADEVCCQERAGGRPSRQSGFPQQPAEAHNLSMRHLPLQHDRSSGYLRAGLETANMPGQHSRQQPSPPEWHHTRRSVGFRQHQQIADAMRRGRAQQTQLCHGPDDRQQTMPPLRQLGSAADMRGSLQSEQMQHSAPVIPTWADHAAHRGTWLQSAAVVPAAALATASAPTEADDLYVRMSMQPDATLYHRQTFAASLSDIFQRKPGRRQN